MCTHWVMEIVLLHTIIQPRLSMVLITVFYLPFRVLRHCNSPKEL